MARSMWLSIIVMGAVGWDIRAGSVLVIPDPMDDSALVSAVSGLEPVKKFAAEIKALEDSLLANDKEKIEKLLGQPAEKPEKDYAIPIGHQRQFRISGLRPADEKMNKGHIAYYPIGDFAGIAIAYGINGTSPKFAVLYFKVDNAFPKLKEVKEKAIDQPAKPKKNPTVTRKHTIDVDHWNKMGQEMDKEQIAELLSAPAGDYAPGTEYLTRSWGWRRGSGGKVHETLEWRSEKARIVVEFDNKGDFVTSEIYLPGQDPVTNVAERLKWDREKFAKVKKYIEERLAAN